MRSFPLFTFLNPLYAKKGVAAMVVDKRMIRADGISSSVSIHVNANFIL